LTSIAITHGGQTLLLNSESDISAWLAERKRRFPTQANIAAKQAQAEALAKARREKNLQRQAESADRKRSKDFTSSKSSRRKQSNVKKESAVKLEPSETTESAVKAESVPDDPLQRIAYLEEQLRLAKEAATRVTPALDAVKHEPQDAESGAEKSPKAEPSAQELKPDLGLGYDSADSSQGATDASDSSSVVSSNSGGDDSDGPPEEQPTKPNKPVRVPPPKRVVPKQDHEGAGGRQACKFFLRSGYCKYKDKCKFSHQLPKDSRKGKGRPDRAPHEAAKPRQSLYEKVSRQCFLAWRIGTNGVLQLVEQELRADAMLGLKAIKHLGNTGFLD
jgi:hypothetical protein